jgi:predicted RNase H-like HicB family nuclease
MERLTFIVDDAEEGGYNARAETASIFTQADTIEELNLNIADAIECHFGDAILPGFSLKFVDKIKGSLF